MELSLNNLKVDPNHEHLQFNVDHADLQLDPAVLNTLDGILDSYEKKKVLNLDELDEEIKGLVDSALQKEMDQRVAEIARREESRRREESIPVKRTGVFQGIRGFSGYTGCSGITGTCGYSGYYGITGTQGFTGSFGHGITGVQDSGRSFTRMGRSDYVEKTSDGFTVRCHVGKPQARSGYSVNE